MLIGLQSQFSNPAFTIMIAKDMISELKDKVEEVRTLVNAEQE
jgi:hypothetical protein